MNHSGTLYTVAVPIGNLGDMTFRAVETLKAVDVIACEDTRTAGLLLQHFDIPKKPFVSLFEHNEERKVASILHSLRSGLNVALISEAGTPTLSDPGYRLVEQSVKQGFNVVPIPGACAAVAALSASGLPTDRFLFLGFPPKKGARLKQFITWATLPGQTSVMYLPARRVEEFLTLLKEAAPETSVVIARELTKLYEEFLRGFPADLLDELSQREPLKGECTLVLYQEGRIRKQNPLEMGQEAAAEEEEEEVRD